ncbi:MAG: hypothetical protein CVV47_16910 [Spirochaetae bacterium HGW-Spirochaetae-3]|jgi:hypothetical protein|nr:MAG: hypothetical protein CVV47_16910 [Spirochaetae bacterium HGW-Spirochaetae-3]
MTDSRDAWLRARERKRAAIAWSSALGAYLLALSLAALFSLFGVEEMADYSGPVIIRLGSPEGVDAVRPSPEPVPAPVAPEPAAVARTPEENPAPAVPREPVATPAPAKPAKAAVPTPAKPAPVSQPAPAPAPVVLRGSENGNSYDMTFMSGSGVVGRSLYVPIWLFMPLPFELPGSIYDSIPDLAGLPGTAPARRAAFESAYRKQADGSWQLKGGSQPRYDARPELWTAIEDAGYDVKNAEYKVGQRLRPVVVLFKVSAPGSDGKPILEAVHIESGSGLSNIDDDVLYGFKKAEFSNSGSTSISGRFTYRF